MRNPPRHRYARISSNDAAVDIGQPEIAAGVTERQPLVVEPELVQMVACRSWMWTWFSTMLKPNSSVWP